MGSQREDALANAGLETFNTPRASFADVRKAVRLYLQGLNFALENWFSVRKRRYHTTVLAVSATALIVAVLVLSLR